MKDRIVQLINNEGLSSSKFADTIGVQRSSISHILSGRNKPSLDFVQKIKYSFPHVNIDWIIFGEGEMYKTKEPAKLFDNEMIQFEKEEETPNTSSQPPKLKKESASKPINQPESFPEMNSFVPGKQIEKVVVFYTDKTFREYNPS
ncbi:MAG: helix-turn-helix domain-containing protein [Marinifilum sp.]|jgi:DNA-binding XRE family transcriptional regulator|nr:helix-turn-helix domain-containing protein [Marinifilum sp.]